MEKNRQILRKHLKRFNSLAKIQFLVDQLFQKDARILSQLNYHLHKRGANVNSALKMIEDHIIISMAKPVNQKMPQKLSSYVFFMELVSLTLDDSKSQWYSFALEADDASFCSQMSKSDIIGLRKWIRKYLPKENINSVQQLMIPLNDTNSIMKSLFRISSFTTSSKNLKSNPQKVEQRLLSHKPVFIAYYSGYPYFYSTSRDIEDHILSALLKSYRCSNSSQIDFSSRDLDSLFRVHSKLSSDDNPEPSIATDIILNNVTIQSNAEYKGNAILGSSTINDNFETSLRMVGSHVLSGLRELQDHGLLKSTTPSWITHLSRAGRDGLVLKDGISPGENPFTQEKPSMDFCKGFENLNEVEAESAKLNEEDAEDEEHDD